MVNMDKFKMIKQMEKLQKALVKSDDDLNKTRQTAMKSQEIVRKLEERSNQMTRNYREKLITNHKEIKHEVNRHYQTIAKIPKDQNIIPEKDEWDRTVSSLKNGSAQGPSLITYEINQETQFAWLPGKSTFEPIQIINEIIEDARENNKEIWILFQDLAKTYDNSVDIKMFKNQEFTVGLTDQYNVKVGIDQGEITSPVLWCIYYDPLFEMIIKPKLEYKIETSYIQ
ncbi:hypothetical protein C1645_882316 [Glomus cerebriforme]|uniref:Reverse transcriptase domain-containing protein n=1 Tax=Glomus cerebriforme TaxID=658196 RepID=A0A397SCR9_9GLOM|nr:hypothetical protein C1645_882316 [Glomus cerebriforme]